MTTLPPTDQARTAEDVHAAVRQRYGAAARTRLQARGDADAEAGACCGGNGCCGPSPAGPTRPPDPVTRDLYDPDTPFQDAVGASLGCGNPTALASLQPGQVVLDLGSGGGLDVLLSARRVGPDGHAYGLDMTDDMLALARRHQDEAGVPNATFLKGQIEDIPLPDGSVDVVISNCVINLAPDKDTVLAEAFRVLRPGGHFAVSDIVLLREIPQGLTEVVALWTGCVSGALRDADYLAKLRRAGFADAEVQVTRVYEREDLEELVRSLAPAQLPDGSDRADVVRALDGAVASAFVRATRPAG